MKNDFRDLQEAYTTSVLPEAKTPKPIKLDGSNLSFLGIGRDANGNKTVKVGAGGKGFSIQTLAPFPTAHRMQMSDAPSEKELKALSKEVNTYVSKFGTKNQKVLMNTVGESAEYDKFFQDTLAKYGVDEPDKLSDEDKKKFFNEIDAGWDAGENETDVDEELEKPEEDDQTDVEVEEELEKPEEDDQTDVDIEVIGEEECDEEEELEEEKDSESEDDKDSLDDISDELDSVKRKKTGSGAPSDDAGDSGGDAVAETVMIGEKKYGLSQGMLNAFRKGADIAVKKVCQRCGFHMPQFSGRYPNACPLCGDEFEAATDVKVMEKYGAYIDGRCVAIVYPIKEAKKVVDMTGKPCDKKNCKGTFKETSLHDDMDGVLHCTKCGKKVQRHQTVKEGKFKDQDMDIQDIVDMFVQKRKLGAIESKDDFNKLFKQIKQGKGPPSGVSADVVKSNISQIAKGIADAFRKEGIKI